MVIFNMPKVVRRENEDLESLLRRFRHQVNDANILGECRKREHFVSNGEKKKERKMRRLMAIRKQEANARREERNDTFGFRPVSQYTPSKGGKNKTWSTDTTQAERPNVVTSATPVKKERANKPAFYSYRKSAPKQQADSSTPKEGK